MRQTPSHNASKLNQQHSKKMPARQARCADNSLTYEMQTRYIEIKGEEAIAANTKKASEKTLRKTKSTIMEGNCINILKSAITLNGGPKTDMSKDQG